MLTAGRENRYCSSNSVNLVSTSSKITSVGVAWPEGKRGASFGIRNVQYAAFVALTAMWHTWHPVKAERAPIGVGCNDNSHGGLVHESMALAVVSCVLLTACEWVNDLKVTSFR